jgi:hypothetical protein
MHLEPMPNREETLSSVREGHISPTEAETWITLMGHDPVAVHSSLDNLDPMLEQEWTFAMAAAWFIWRSPLAVRDQWDRFRISWLANSGAKQLTPLLEVSLPHLFRSTDLKRFSIAPTQQRGAEPKTAINRSPTQIHSPRARFENAITSGKLNVTGSAVHNLARTSIKSPFLEAHFEYVMQSRNGSDPLAKGCYLYAPRFTELHVYRNEVISVDEAYSQAEFDLTIWTTEHVLGWIAYRDPRRMRPIMRTGPSDTMTSPSNPLRTIYPFDFKDLDPDATLHSALRNNELDAELAAPPSREGVANPIPAKWWRTHKLTDAPRLSFRRDLVVTLWPPLEARTAANDWRNAQTADQIISAHPRTFDEMTPTHQAIINVMRHLWPDRGWPPNQSQRRIAMNDEYVTKRKLGPAVPDIKTIKLALKAFENLMPQVPWTETP